MKIDTQFNWSRGLERGLKRHSREGCGGHLQFTALAEWWNRRRARSALAELPDRLLRDIGIGRSEIEARVRHGRSDRR